jgi:hypothetical protein
MDQSRFDAITRGFAAPATRRRMLTLALAGIVGSAVAPARVHAGVCRPAGKHCRRGGGCCPGAGCVAGWCRPQEACGPASCGAGTYCCNASCGICAPVGEGCTQELC